MRSVSAFYLSILSSCLSLIPAPAAGKNPSRSSGGARPAIAPVACLPQVSTHCSVSLIGSLLHPLASPNVVQRLNKSQIPLDRAWPGRYRICKLRIRFSEEPGNHAEVRRASRPGLEPWPHRQPVGEGEMPPHGLEPQRPVRLPQPLRRRTGPSPRPRASSKLQTPSSTTPSPAPSPSSLAVSPPREKSKPGAQKCTEVHGGARRCTCAGHRSRFTGN
jgi:hypothetical protein